MIGGDDVIDADGESQVALEADRIDSIRPKADVVNGKHIFAGYERKEVVPFLTVVLLLSITSLAIALGFGVNRSDQPINQPSPAEKNATANNTSIPQYDIEPPQPSSSPTSCPSYPAIPPLSKGKRGIGYTMRAEGERGSWSENLPKVKALAPYWHYSWGARLPDEARLEGIEFIPMVWGAQSLERLNGTFGEVLSDTSARRVLGFNEPDREQQANMDVDSALQYWSRLELLELPLISPACAGTTSEWMKTFMQKAVENCLRVDAVAIHWYGSPNLAKFQEDLQKVYRAFGKPVMVTEFAPADWDAQSMSGNKYARQQVLSFMQAALPWLEDQDWIVAYSWFPFEEANPIGTSSSLFGSDGNMTALGRFYASVTTENPLGNQSIVVTHS